MRVGIGHDTHRLQPGGPLRLGGIDVRHDHELVGHSDADVLLHAITDALLGAASLGDIGELFPNSSEANRDRDSGQMLQIAASKIRKLGYEIGNLDCIVFAQEPKLGEYKRAMASQIATLLEIKADQVTVKAKTGESVGPVGRREAMAAECICLIKKQEPIETRK